MGSLSFFLKCRLLMEEKRLGVCFMTSFARSFASQMIHRSLCRSRRLCWPLSCPCCLLCLLHRQSRNTPGWGKASCAFFCSFFSFFFKLIFTIDFMWVWKVIQFSDIAYSKTLSWFLKITASPKFSYWLSCKFWGVTVPESTDSAQSSLLGKLVKISEFIFAKI